MLASAEGIMVANFCFSAAKEASVLKKNVKLKIKSSNQGGQENFPLK